MCPILTWSTNADAAIVEATTGFQLRQLGWKGFEALPWVIQLHTKYPDMQDIAIYASSISGCRLNEVSMLLEKADVSDRPSIISYFVGKLALEKLSCTRGGAGAGMCDKFSAFLQIFEYLTCNWK